MATRRAFVAAGLSAATLPWLPRRQAVPDLVLRGGTVLDGSGRPAFEADVAVTGDRITAVGPSLPRAGQEIDVRGLAVAPGFLDIHSHGDGTLRADPRAESVIRQGITTIVVGQDGSSRPVRELLASMAELGPSVNLATMVGLGSVRTAVLGSADRPPSPDELERMVALVESALSEGACGASSGLEYIPGGFASVGELVALARPLAARGLPYATHLRNEDDRLMEALEEAVAVAEQAGCPLQVSHLKAQGPRNWHRMGEALELLERTASRGVDVGFDVYPYVAYQTGLTNLLPLWSREGGFDGLRTRLGDSSVAPRIRTETLAKIDLLGGWNNVMISGVGAAADSAAEGARVGDLARARNVDPWDLVVDLVIRSRGDAGMVGFAMSEENVERALAHPLAIVCSDGGAFATDGPARRGHPHPRSLGTFPRVLGRYVRERRVLPLEAAIQKMTSRPAARVGLRDRGLLRPGGAADLVAFDPGTVNDLATFADPYRYPSGIALVVVNGRVALRDGVPLERVGRALRPR